MSKRGQILFFFPALLLVALFVLIPTVQTMVESFHAGGPHSARSLSLDYYRYAFEDPKLLLATRNNLTYFLWTLLFEVAAGLVLALGLETPSRLNHFLRVIFFSPAVLSMVIVGLVFGFLFKEGLGPFSQITHLLPPLLLISLVSGWAYAGFFMVIFLAALAAIPEEVLEAARLDGASAWQTFCAIKLPLLLPTLGVAIFLCFTGAFKAFDLFWVLAPNQDDASILSTLLIKEVFNFGNDGYGAAIATLLTGLVMVSSALALALRHWAATRPPLSPAAKPS